jgi:putative redox protein
MGKLWREVTAEWKGDHGFMGQNPAGSMVQMGTIDGKVACSPMELVLMSLAGRSSMTILSILEKKHIQLEDMSVKVLGKRPDQDLDETAGEFTDIDVSYIFYGKNINPSDIETAIKLTDEKYCPVVAMLSKAVPIHYDYQILENK